MSHDTWIHRIGRKALVEPLSRTSVTPDQLTTARLASGVMAAAALGVGAAPWPDIGAALFVLSVVLDRADGDLARLTGQTSESGHRYDLIADSLSNALILIGLGIGLRGGEFGLWSVPMGIAAGVSVSVILHQVLKLEGAGGARSGELPAFGGFDVDDLVLVIPLAIWLGHAEGLLVAATIVAPAFALFFVWLARRRLRAAKSEP